MIFQILQIVAILFQKYQFGAIEIAVYVEITRQS